MPRPSARLLPAAAVGAVLVGGVSAVLAVATGTGYDGGVLTALLLLAVGHLGYLWRSAGRLQGGARRAAAAGAAAEAATREAAVTADARYLELRAALDELAAQHRTVLDELAALRADALRDRLAP